MEKQVKKFKRWVCLVGQQEEHATLDLGVEFESQFGGRDYLNKQI